MENTGLILPRDILNKIFSHSDNYYCILVCKLWKEIIFNHIQICGNCNKIIKMYDVELWFNLNQFYICI